MKKWLTLILVGALTSTTLGTEQTPEYFSPEQINEDINFLVNFLDKTHPTFGYEFSSSELEEIKMSITKPMTKHDFFKRMQPFASVDGHTSFMFNGTIFPEIENPLFPCRIIAFDNQIFIKENVSDNPLLGTKKTIESVNGISSTEIIETLNQYIPHDGSKIQYEKLSEDFHIFFRLVYGNFQEFEIKIKNNDKPIFVKGVNWDAFPKPPEQQFESYFINDSTFYFKVGNFRKPAIFMNYVDSVFTLLKSKNVPNLIIDKRRGGGFTTLADSLLSYLTNEPYQGIVTNKVKMSSSNTDYVEEKKESGTIQGNWLTLNPGPIQPVDRENKFTGKCYVLIGPKTVSAAVYFAAAIKCSNIATLVGRQTLQPLISNGGITRTQLPNTQLYFISSMSTIYYPCAQNITDGLKPDIMVDLKINDLFSTKDKYIETALETIQQN